MKTPPKAPVLCLDGPSGSGKGAVGQRCALRLGWHYLDSGAIYRALAYRLRQAGVDPVDERAALAIAGTLEVECLPRPDDSAAVLVQGVDVGAALRSEDVGDTASRLAADAAVRDAVLAAQRRARRPPGLVADGRDMGTTVFPDATLKIFLTASLQVRVQRRYKQLKLKGFSVNLPDLFRTIQERDARDARRRASPLVAAEDAVTLDTSDLEIDEVASRILDLLQPRLVRTRAHGTGIANASADTDSRDSGKS